jgi:ribonuclease PH
LVRRDGRRADEIRPVRIIRGFTRFAPGSVLIQCGETHVLCTASWQNSVPEWKQGKGTGWVTAEYDMLPGATGQRRPRNRMRIDGRTQEIQRLVGRALRAVVNVAALGENSILIDCDVLQADGGTRTAAITGAYVALVDAVRVARSQNWISSDPITGQIAAISAGRVDGTMLLDLDYSEDSAAQVDLNVVMNAAGEYIEVQGTGEGATFSRGELDRILRLAAKGIGELLEAQRRALQGSGFRVQGSGLEIPAAAGSGDRRKKAQKAQNKRALR